MNLNATSSFWQVRTHRQISLATYLLPSESAIGEYRLQRQSFPCDWLIKSRLEPILYRVVDIDDEEKAKLFISCLQLRPGFAKTSVKVLHLQPTVSPEQGAKILALCQGLQELTLQIVNHTNLLDEENPLRGLLRDLRLTTLCMNIASVFYGPNIYLPDLILL